MTKIIKIIIQFFKKIKNIKYTKKLALEKEKIYIKDDNIFKKKYSNKRNRFKLFKTKLEFENTVQNIKNINIYYYIIWLFLIISSIYLFIFSHYFSIKNIDIIRQSDLININIVYNSIEDIRYKPLIFANKEEIKNHILAHQPNISYVNIKKILPDNLKIILWSFDSVFLFNLWDKIYEITKNWTVIPWKEKKNIKLKIVWLDNLWIMDYKKIFNEYHITQMTQLLDQLKQKIPSLTYKNYTYYKKESEFHIVTEKWTIIIFDLNKDINVQVKKLNIFLNKKDIKKNKNAIIYIDLRVNQKIFYCDSSNEFQCRLNLNLIYN